MPYPYNTLEYKHLLAAQRAIAQEIEKPTENTNLATLATSLCRVIDQKRIMRGQPAPKPADASDRRVRGKARAQVIDVPYTPLVIDAPPPTASESKPS